MFRVLSITLLMVTPLLAAPHFENDDHVIINEAEGRDTAVWSEEETTTEHLELDDPTGWSASTEVLDENPAWYRRRRSLEGVPSVDAAEEEVTHGSVALQSARAMSPFIRDRKKLAEEECKRRRRDFATWGSKNPIVQVPPGNRCNSYCCYPVYDETQTA